MRILSMVLLLPIIACAPTKHKSARSKVAAGSAPTQTTEPLIKEADVKTSGAKPASAGLIDMEQIKTFISKKLSEKGNVPPEVAKEISNASVDLINSTINQKYLEIVSNSNRLAQAVMKLRSGAKLMDSGKMKDGILAFIKASRSRDKEQILKAFELILNAI